MGMGLLIQNLGLPSDVGETVGEDSGVYLIVVYIHIQNKIADPATENSVTG